MAGLRRLNTKASPVCRERTKKEEEEEEVAVAVVVVEYRSHKRGKELVQPAHRPGMLAYWQYRKLRRAAGHKFAVGRLLPEL